MIMMMTMMMLMQMLLLMMMILVSSLIALSPQKLKALEPSSPKPTAGNCKTPNPKR